MPTSKPLWSQKIFLDHAAWWRIVGHIWIMFQYQDSHSMCQDSQFKDSDLKMVMRPFILTRLHLYTVTTHRISAEFHDQSYNTGILRNDKSAWTWIIISQSVGSRPLWKTITSNLLTHAYITRPQLIKQQNIITSLPANNRWFTQTCTHSIYIYSCYHYELHHYGMLYNKM